MSSIELRWVAVEAAVDERTVTRFLAGLAVRDAMARRIEGAIARLRGTASARTLPPLTIPGKGRKG